MSGHWLIVLPNGHRVRSDCCAPAGLKSRQMGRLELGRRVIVVGGIRIQGSLLGAPGVRINGNVEVAGRVVIGAGSTLKGNVRSGADLHLLPGTRVDGWIESGADLHIHEGVSVGGALSSGGDLIVHGPATTGPVTCGGRVATQYGIPDPRNARSVGKAPTKRPPTHKPPTPDSTTGHLAPPTDEDALKPAPRSPKSPAVVRDPVAQNLLQ